jgi:hypothetical protein
MFLPRALAVARKHVEWINPTILATANGTSGEAGDGST